MTPWCYKVAPCALKMVTWWIKPITSIFLSTSYTYDLTAWRIRRCENPILSAVRTNGEDSMKLSTLTATSSSSPLRLTSTGGEIDKIGLQNVFRCKASSFSIFWRCESYGASLIWNINLQANCLSDKQSQCRHCRSATHERSRCFTYSKREPLLRHGILSAFLSGVRSVSVLFKQKLNIRIVQWHFVRFQRCQSQKIYSCCEQN